MLKLSFNELDSWIKHNKTISIFILLINISFYKDTENSSVVKNPNFVPKYYFTQ